MIAINDRGQTLQSLVMTIINFRQSINENSINKNKYIRKWYRRHWLRIT